MQLFIKTSLIVCLLGVAVCRAEPTSVSPGHRIKAVDADKKVLAVAIGLLATGCTWWVISNGLQPYQSDRWPLKYFPKWVASGVSVLASFGAYAVTPATVGLATGLTSYVLICGGKNISVEELSIDEQGISAEDYQRVPLIRQAVWGDRLSVATTPWSDEQLLTNIRELQAKQVPVEAVASVLEYMQIMFALQGQLDADDLQIALVRHRLKLIQDNFVLEPLKLALERKKFGIDSDVSDATPVVTP